MWTIRLASVTASWQEFLAGHQVDFAFLFKIDGRLFDILCRKGAYGWVNLGNGEHKALCSKLNDATFVGAACHCQEWIIAADHFTGALSAKGDEQSHAY